MNGGTLVGKRSRSDAGHESEGQESMPQKRKKKQPSSYGTYLQGKDLS